MVFSKVTLLASLLIDKITTKGIRKCGLSSKIRQSAALFSYEEGKRNIKDPWKQYWKTRKNYVYMFVVNNILNIIARSANSIVDIGSNRTPTLDFVSHVPVKYSVDPETPYIAPGIVSLHKDFLKWTPDKKINVGICLQVMEHIPNESIKEFARHMLSVYEVVLVSVPYLEKEGTTSTHIQHSIDLEKINDWFGRLPNYYYIATELSKERRIICLFDTLSEKPIKHLNVESIDAINFRFRWLLKDDD